MSVIIGSARIGETGRATGGKAGDQKQKGTPDYSGEVSMQNFYIHQKGWIIIRAKLPTVANKLAAAMKRACNNPNIGYDQNERYRIVKEGTGTKKKVDSDCSSTVRECVKEATGKDPGDFTTANAVQVLEKTGSFEPAVEYRSGTKLYTGDILCTKTKGHIVIVVSGAARNVPAAKKKAYAGAFPKLPARGYYILGDGYKTLKSYKKQIIMIQEFLNWALGSRLDRDGQYGPQTEADVIRFQKKAGVKTDGSWGPVTQAAAKKYKK